jgi:hypothetical protein
MSSMISYASISVSVCCVFLSLFFRLMIVLSLYIYCVVCSFLGSVLMNTSLITTLITYLYTAAITSFHHLARETRHRHRVPYTVVVALQAATFTYYCKLVLVRCQRKVSLPEGEIPSLMKKILLRQLLEMRVFSILRVSQTPSK